MSIDGFRLYDTIRCSRSKNMQSESSTRFKVVGGGKAEVVMRRCWVGFGEDRPLRLARLGDKDVEEAVLVIDCKEEIWDAMVVQGALRRRARRLV